jgi:succinyl-diaminopimelate desuccinylase
LGESAILKMLEYLAKLPSGIVVMEIEGGTSFNAIPAHAVLEIDAVAGVKDALGPKIARLMREIAKIESEFARYPAAGFEPPIPTLSIGMIRTRSDHVTLLGCGRMPPSVDQAADERWMAALRAACEDIGAAFRITEHKQPFQTRATSPLVEACQSELRHSGLNSACHSLSSTNEANVFSRFGIECVAVGPGKSVGNSHAPNEHVKIEQLHQAVRFYKGVIERICL